DDRLVALRLGAVAREELVRLRPLLARVLADRREGVDLARRRREGVAEGRAGRGEDDEERRREPRPRREGAQEGAEPERGEAGGDGQAIRSFLSQATSVRGRTSGRRCGRRRARPHEATNV